MLVLLVSNIRFIAYTIAKAYSLQLLLNKSTEGKKEEVHSTRRQRKGTTKRNGKVFGHFEKKK